jgi:hypothetical protein
MTTLVINGQKVEVSDNFTSMTPEEQARAVDEIAQSMGATPAAPDQSPRRGVGYGQPVGNEQHPGSATAPNAALAR